MQLHNVRPSRCRCPPAANPTGETKKWSELFSARREFEKVLFLSARVLLIDLAIIYYSVASEVKCTLPTDTINQARYV